MSLIFPDGSRTRSYGPGDKFPALPQQPKASQPGVGKPPPIMTSSGPTQDYYASKTGQAQSTPQPSQGTPYSAYAPNSSSSFATNTDGVNRTFNANAYNNASSGNFANNPTSRPAPFTQGATGLDGQRVADPSRAFSQRDAMIERLNTNKSKYTANAGVYQGEGAPPASFGQRPQYDFNSLMGQANDMVQQGWSNPFSKPVNEAGFPSPAPDYMGFGDNGPYEQVDETGFQPRRTHPSYKGYGDDTDYGPVNEDGFMPPNKPQVRHSNNGDQATAGPYGPRPQSPGRAQPMAPQQPPSGYNPGMPAQPPSDFIDHQRWLNGTGGGRLPARSQAPVRMPYAGGMDYEQGPPVVRPGLTLRPPPRRTGMAGYHPARRR